MKYTIDQYDAFLKSKLIERNKSQTQSSVVLSFWNDFCQFHMKYLDKPKLVSILFHDEIDCDHIDRSGVVDFLWRNSNHDHVELEIHPNSLVDWYVFLNKEKGQYLSIGSNDPVELTKEMCNTLFEYIGKL